MPSFFGADEFSFLDTYREKSDDEDESDNERSQTSSSSSVSEGSDEQEFVYNTSARPRFGLPESPAAAPNNHDDDSDDEDDDDEPSPWRGSKAKRRIIEKLKDDESPIHSMDPTEVHERFASRYRLNLFKANYKRLLEQLKGKTGPFEEGKTKDSEDAQPTVEKWYSSGKLSTGYSLLYNILMEPEGTGIEEMSPETIWQSHAAFRCYDFESFRGYLKNMQALTKKHRKIVAQDEADFQHDMELITEKSGLIWYKHPAKELLKEDVASGMASSMKPRELRETRPEYREFSVTKFCKEVHHEKQRQRAKPFWQWFRNKEAREMHESQVNELRRTWIHDNDVEKLRQEMERIWTPHPDEKDS